MKMFSFIYAISQYHAQFYQLKCFYYITLSLFFFIKEIVWIISHEEYITNQLWVLPITGIVQYLENNCSIYDCTLSNYKYCVVS